MTDLTARGFLPFLEVSRRANTALMRFFRLRAGGIFNGKEVEIDIRRWGEPIAVVIKNLRDKQVIALDLSTNKKYEPPIYGPEMSMDVDELFERMLGEDPYTAGRAAAGPTGLVALDPRDRAMLINKFGQGFAQMLEMILRAGELQAAQIFQTGQMDLLDEDGDSAFTIDFAPKAALYPTVSTSWSDTANATPIADLTALAEAIRDSGKRDVQTGIFGATALANFKANDEVKEQFDNLRIDPGMIRTELRGSGLNYHGFVSLGDFVIDILTYAGRYDDPQTGNTTKYMAEDKVVLLDAEARRDILSARIPRLVRPDERVAELMPPQVTSPTTGEGTPAGFVVRPNVYTDNGGEAVIGSLKSKFMLNPTEIDAHGCLDTEI